MSYLELDDLILGARTGAEKCGVAPLANDGRLSCDAGRCARSTGTSTPWSARTVPAPATTLRSDRRVDPERVRGAVFAQRGVERLVYGGDAVVSAPDVEGDQRRPTGHQLGQRRAVGSRRGLVGCTRAELQHAPAARIGGDEISAPGLDGAERSEVPQPDVEGTVAPWRATDERASLPGGDRLDAVVIAGGQVITDRTRPILDGRPVGILAVAVARTRALGCDHDLVLMRRDERRRQECVLGVGLPSGRRAVEEEDDWVASGVGAVTRREVDTRGELAAQRGRSASDRRVGTDEARTESALRREKWPLAGEDDHGSCGQRPERVQYQHPAADELASFQPGHSVNTGVRRCRVRR
jgi:hypothetical protein